MQEDGKNELHQQGNANIGVQNVTGNVNIVVHHSGEKKQLPRALSNLPRIDPAQVIGRDTALNELQQIITGNKLVALIKGQGGIGKTTLAKLYLNTFFNDYNSLAWVVYENDLQSSFSNDPVLRQSISIIADSNLKPDEQLSQFLYSLRSIEGRNLLIIDNAKATVLKDPLYPLLPDHSHWDILLTSREEISGFTRFDLERLSSEDATALFVKLYPKAENDPQLPALLQYIGYNTLGIEIIAKTLKRFYGEKDAAFMLDLFKGQAMKEVTKKIKTDHTPEERTILEVLLKTFDISALGENEKAIWILKQFYMLLPVEYEYSRLKEWLQIGDEEEDEFEAALNHLVETGWLRVSEDGLFSAHRLVQDVIGYTPGVVWEDVAALGVSLWRLIRYPDCSTENYALKFVWNPYGEFFLGKVPEIEEWEKVDLAQLRNDLAILLEEEGKSNRAIAHYEKALDYFLKTEGGNGSGAAALRTNMALIYQVLGRLTEAEELMEEALATDLIIFGQKHPRVANARSNLALIYKDLDWLPEAADLMEEALASIDKSFGEKHPVTAVFRSDLALIYKDLDKLPEAAELMEKALALNFKTFKEQHTNLATLSSNLAIFYQDLGRKAECTELIEKTLDQKIFGEEHPLREDFRSIHSTLYTALRRVPEAADLMEKALDSFEKTLGETHPDVITIRSNLAVIYQNLGRLQEAALLMEKAMASNLKTFGEEHPTIAVSRSNLAMIYKDLGRLPEAAELMEKALASELKFFGENHSRVTLSRSNLASIYHDVGMLSEAAELMEKFSGQEDHLFFTSYNNSELNGEEFVSKEEIVGFWEMAYQVAAKTLGVNHPKTKTISNNLAQARTHLP